MLSWFMLYWNVNKLYVCTYPLKICSDADAMDANGIHGILVTRD